MLDWLCVLRLACPGVAYAPETKKMQARGIVPLTPKARSFCKVHAPGVKLG